ncbi:MAG TPA: FAD-dependent oxidoreductase [Bacteroidetes bacterium]|nr:FAD-dependent oxidoreductase [Bacteroidota bacterium]
MKHLIIGGVAGGATAAARIRRVDESAEIVLLERGKHISYANCGLPYYIGGTIEDRERLFLQTPQSFKNRFNVDVRVENEAIAIDPAKKTVTVRGADGNEYTENYDNLLLSPGAHPVKPPLQGVDLEGIFTLRDVSDTDRIKNYITSRDLKRAVIVGAGFIGLEMAENLHHIGAEIIVVELAKQVMSPIDFSMAAHVHQHLLQKGVALYLERSINSFSRKGEQIEVHFKDGEIVATDMVILSIGVRPETSLAEAAGIKIGETGGIWVNEYLETSKKNIYAVGDAIEFPHPLTGKPWLNYLANPANRQGRIVADNMVFGNKTKYEGAIGTCIAKVFDMTVASTGLPGKKLKQMEIAYGASWTHSGSHAGYYPNSTPLSLKITFDPATGKLYGGQCVGYSGVDKRIDQIALLIKNGGTVYDLIKIEHSYAPPFSSAKDPIAIAGYVASNIISGAMPILTWREIQDVHLDDAVIVDVRTRDEHAMGAIPASINIPVDELRNRLDELPKNKEIIIYCAIGLRGYLATKILTQNGFTRVKNLSGGYKTYSTAVAPVRRIEPVVLPNDKSHNIDQQNMRAEIRQMRVDARGLQCPGPVLKLKESIDTINEGERVEIVATDAGFARDAQAWCNTTGNTLISSVEDKGNYTVIVEKGSPKSGKTVTSYGRGKTFIMFSDDLDKALATFVLANGAAATGEKVTIFFTFWGLNVIKKVEKPQVSKDIFGRLFGTVLKSNSQKLQLSKMKMLGLSGKMTRYIMKKKGIDSLESLRDQALANGAEFIACQMSMDFMGIKREELLDNVTVGGVATYMERADNANLNLFI